ncbi:IS5/IS1182 family transposase, partial [Comamonas aquatica]|nr:IS5/IS1182 family transposase [Comamonas aquatica]MDH1675577.1 IS5/IS1182 family transposase [Comamonas aquatica]MDH1679199.1 IS5/IS1182 family transposase [Comamonas aquatica]
MRTKKYPSDTSREQFEIIKPLLEGARKKTK